MTNKPFPIIYNLYVEPKYRRQGKGKHLIMMTIGEIKRNGYMGKISIEAKSKDQSINMKSLIHFYEYMGLEVINKNEVAEGETL
jgi:ribosomal protein S18 acetylase RimI-like enzyme